MSLFINTIKESQVINSYNFARNSNLVFSEIISKDNYKKLKEIIFKFKKSNIRTSLFINPNLNDIKLSKKLNVDCVEIHTGKISNIVKAKKKYANELNRIKKCLNH